MPPKNRAKRFKQRIWEKEDDVVEVEETVDVDDSSEASELEPDVEDVPELPSLDPLANHVVSTESLLATFKVLHSCCRKNSYHFFVMY